MITQFEEPLSVRKDDFTQAFRSPERVQGFTHDFYKYPARFSPNFARFVINAFTRPGDCVLDPFMGGGTTVVEAILLGRQIVGSDINELAQFVARVKTTPLSHNDIVEVWDWVRNVRKAIVNADFASPQKENGVRNMPTEIVPFFATATKLSEGLQFPRRRQFARCALLRLGQWALDGRSIIPDTHTLCDALEDRVEIMQRGLREFVSETVSKDTPRNKITGARKILAYSAADAPLADTLLRQSTRPKLVLTSPPYPGVHILYHRWQILGRRETPAPYWIADIRDGFGESHYTMGSRTESGLKNYFTGIKSAFTNIRRVVDQDSRVVQLISFSNAASQLPRYLDTMQAAGFEETNEGSIWSRQVRVVPNRKWYTQNRPQNDSSCEVLLIHRPSY